MVRLKESHQVLRPVLQSNQKPLCGLHRSRDRGRGGPNGQIVSIKRAADGRQSKKIIDEEKKVQGQEQILAKHLDGIEKSNSCDFDKPRKRAHQKGKVESNEQSKEGGHPK